MEEDGATFSGTTVGSEKEVGWATRLGSAAERTGEAGEEDIKDKELEKKG